MQDDRRIQLLKKDFKAFLIYIFRELRLPTPTTAQLEIADFLQHGPKRGIIECFRGIGKSLITSIYVCWLLFKDPNEKILVVSATKDRAIDFSTFTQNLISEIPILQFLQPSRDQRASKMSFDVGPAIPTHAPSVKSVGIFGQLTGSRGTTIIADDIEVPNNSATQDLRVKLLKAVSEFEAILVPDDPRLGIVSRIMFLGTPQTEESVYNSLRLKGYKALIWPARFPDETMFVKYNGALAPRLVRAVELDPELVNTTTEPTRFSDKDLLERELSYGRSGFALQFMLDTSLSDAERYPLKMGDCIVMSLNAFKAPMMVSWGNDWDLIHSDLPRIGFGTDKWYKPQYVDKRWLEFETKIMAIDPSGRGKDETAYCIIGQLNGFIYLLEADGIAGGYDPETLDKLAAKAQEFCVDTIVVESNFGGGMWTELFKPVLSKRFRTETRGTMGPWSCALEEVRHNTQKEKRIVDTLEPVMNQHKLIIDIAVVKKDLLCVKEGQDNMNKLQFSLFYQLTHITKDRGSLLHDDRLDSLAMAIAHCTNMMARDLAQEEIDYEQGIISRDLKEYSENIGVLSHHNCINNVLVNGQSREDNSDGWNSSLFNF